MIVKCEQCGAPLEVKNTATYVDCRYCGATTRLAARPAPPPVPFRPPQANPRVVLFAFGAIGLVSILSVVIFVVVAGAGRLGSPSLHAFIGPERPVLVDLDRDGIRDVVGMGWNFGGNDHIVAIAGSDAHLMWMRDLGDIDFDRVMTFVPGSSTIVYADARGRLRGIDARSGETRWEGDLGERVVAACPGQEGFLLMKTSDELRFRVRLSDGQKQRVGPFEPCEPVARVSDDRFTRHRFMTGWDPYPRVRPVVSDGTLHGTWADPATGRIVVAIQSERDGRTVGEVAMFDPSGQLVWRQLATAQPDFARPYLVMMQAQGDVLYVVYDMTRRSNVPRRITAFDLATGQRRWEGALQSRGSQVDFVFGDERRVYVCHWALEILDARNGRHIGRAGKFLGER